ncbi:MAG: hypothetical protein V4724_08825 [Pseudomonadota bacterium]
MQDTLNDAARPRFRPVPWTALETPADAELWIEEHNLALKEHIAPHETGYGVRFTLAEGGDIYLQTSADGAVILDVTADAAWVAPLIVAVAQVEPPAGSLWVLPDDRLVQLIIGLSSLIASSTLVAGHPFGRVRQRQY